MQLSHERILYSCFSIPDPDEDSNPTSTVLDEEALGSFESFSNSEDIDAAAALLLNVRDLEYEDDEDTSSDDEEGIRRYLRSNGMSRRLPQLTNKTGYMCDPSFWNCMVVADTTLIPSSYSEITGIVLGCVVAVGGAIVLGLACYKYKRRQSRCPGSKEEVADDDDRTYVSNLTQEALEMEVI